MIESCPAHLPDCGTRNDEGNAAVLGMAGWLALAASPTFALMAWVAASDAPSIAHRSSGLSILPIDGMTAMYLLMSLFHLSPWLKLASGRRSARTYPIAQGDCPMNHAIVSREEWLGARTP